MLHPLNTEGYKKAVPGAPYWRQIIDGRVPSMVFAGSPQADKIGDGDFVRLCFVDGPGTDAFPHAEACLANFKKDNCYDRFWYGKFPSRILLSSYCMAMIGVEDASDEKDFFREALQAHFRRHYFQLALLNQF